ncbi:CheR family methyltransferase [Psychromonas aquimarina]|uniref:CheR family methyltransferase n=1 Tax=Psychromonas aquimarina TaxID=444919 RepID=UPI000404CDE1|nr:protein-glutamate O-methyltransferase CheR [Psychromonas aquimarina]
MKPAAVKMEDKQLQAFEIDCLLEAILLRYGYDFRNYARASLKRRIHNRLALSNLRHVSEMIPLILYDESFFSAFLGDMSITVTEMFRNPEVFKFIREQVTAKLRTYSRVNIWNVGCATGEEAYSMAIILEEEGLLDKTHIYATDYDNQALEAAKTGIYPVNVMQQYTENYLKAGGRRSFSDYYQARYESAKMKNSLRDKITFAHHNLMRDGSFAEMHLILCRNVLIYFDQTLQNSVLTLLRNSMVHRGYLVLGDKETLGFSAVENDFESVDDKRRIYRKKILT